MAVKKSEKTKEKIEELQYTPSFKEIENGKKVLAILENMDDIGYTMHRLDLFSVVEPELGLEISVDAEEDVICLLAEICDREHFDKNVANWQELLLSLNSNLLHGAFTLQNDKIYMRENLAAENLDPNELED
ncbi:MAG TPA: hypothetical protein PLR86_00795, partial [Planctomycetota bacterium]|nr:hypothetical protein [Planctomycetota bacterium]